MTYNTEGWKGQIPLHINIDSVMKGKITKITSPSHTLESEIKESADENGQYLAKTGLGDTKEIKIVYRLFLVNCYLLHVPNALSM